MNENQNLVAEYIQPVAETAQPSNEVTFYFREPTAKMKDVNKEEGLPEPIRRQTVTIALPLLTKEQVLEILLSDEDKDTKAQELIVEQVNSVLVAEVRSQLDDMPNYAEVEVSAIDFAKVDFVALANTPRATRSGGGISEETWADFEADFVEVLTTKTSTEEATAKKVVTLLTKRLKDVSTKEVVLQKLGDYLDTWFTQTTEAQQVALASVYERLNKRIEGYKATVNDDPLAALGI